MVLTGIKKLDRNRAARETFRYLLQQKNERNLVLASYREIAAAITYEDNLIQFKPAANMIMRAVNKLEEAGLIQILETSNKGTLFLVEQEELSHATSF